MRKYSIFAVAREAMRGHRGWDKQWRSPEPKKSYDVIIVGAGGHGLGTAYYLAKEHGITNVAVIEKGWLGGGNTGRNTTIIRSNYLQDPSAAIYEKSRSLYETMSQDLNYNVMYSPRGVMMLAQTEHEVRGYKRTAHANGLQGVQTEFISPERVKELCPIIELKGPRYPVLGALWQRGTDTAAFTTLWAGHGIAIAVFIATQLGYWPIHFTANVGLMTLVSCIIYAAVSLSGSHGAGEEYESATWSRALATEALRDDAPIYANVTIWAWLLGAAMLGILVLFW